MLVDDGIAVTRLALSAADDPSGALAERYLDAARSAVYLIRPDQHVAARWPACDESSVRAALRVATGREGRADTASSSRAVPGSDPVPPRGPALGANADVAASAGTDHDRDEAPATPGASATDRIPGGAGEAAPGLTLSPNVEDGDGFYDELLQAHEGLDATASEALNARLVLVLCNHVGDRTVIREALRAARTVPIPHQSDIS